MNIHSLRFIITKPLDSLSQNFATYFPDDDQRTGTECVRNPISDSKEIDLYPVQGEQIMELSSDKGLESRYKSNITLPAFWIHTHGKFSELSGIALIMIMPCSSTCMHEAEYSALTSMKVRYRNRINVKSPVHLAFIDTGPHFDKLVSAEKCH